LLTILFFSPSNSIGGAELSLLHTMKYMRNKGVRIILAMPPNNDASYYQMVVGVANSIYLVKGMNWISSKKKGLAKLKNWAYSIYLSGGWHLVPVYKLATIILCEGVDLVHTNTTVSIDGALAAKITGRPHVQHIREITGAKDEALFKLKFQGTSFFRKLYANLNITILCNSYYTLKQSETDFPKEKLKVIYNTIKLPRALPDSFRGGVLQVCTMANVTARMKNHLLVLKVAKCLKDAGKEANFKFNLFGKLPPVGDSYLNSLQNFIAKNKLHTMVEFKGISTTAEILNCNHVLFHTFSGESFGRVYIEAMSYGRPVIAVKGGGASELIEDGENGYLVGEDNPETVAETLIKLANDSIAYNLLRQNGIEKSKSFSEENVFPDLLKTYSNIINKGL
jgi:glycosyltransferase involved in cell wall biosynthesis